MYGPDRSEERKHAEADVYTRVYNATPFGKLESANVNDPRNLAVLKLTTLVRRLIKQNPHHRGPFAQRRGAARRRHPPSDDKALHIDPPHTPRIFKNSTIPYI